jgi:hypothetical protein
MQCIEHLGKHSTIWSSVHREPLTVFFNGSIGITFTEAVNVQYRSTFSICEDVRRFSQHSYNVTINSRNGQLTVHTDSHAPDSVAGWREGRTVLGAQSKQLYSQISLSRKPFGIGHIHTHCFA